MSHTPGPWHVNDRGWGSLTIRADKRFGECTDRLNRTRSAFNVCAVMRIVEQDTAISNARLIAAAPELLEVLRELDELADNYEDIDWHGNPNFAMQVRQIIAPIIAKAIGDAK